MLRRTRCAGRSGRRGPTQVCLSNPEVLQLTVEAVLNKLNEGYDPAAALIWFVNQVAEAVEPAYHEAVIDTFACEYTRRAPKNKRLRTCIIPNMHRPTMKCFFVLR